MQSRVSTNGHVRTTEVVINRSDETDNVQMLVLISILLGDLF